MPKFHDKTMPGESAAYRDARDSLLDAELNLRRQIEKVAALRRELPLGGAVKEDYVFDERDASGGVKQTRLSELFADGKPSLVLYSLMYGPGGSPCTMCTAMLDGLDGNVPHISDRTNIAVVAKDRGRHLPQLPHRDDVRVRRNRPGPAPYRHALAALEPARPDARRSWRLVFEFGVRPVG